ncbi:MAG: VTT domain-containing protein, partial [Candidatus Korarchaeota archaeon]|nr:VTT domain-containing protein [Candidatus Korarchaeota archaeon]
VYSWFDRWGGWLVFITRLIPFLPLDVTSYVAGAVGMNFLVFVLANVLAIVPRATFFGLVGAKLAEGDWTLLVLSVVMLLVGAYFFSRQVIKGGKGE